MISTEGELLVFPWGIKGWKGKKLDTKYPAAFTAGRQAAELGTGSSASWL